MRTKEALCLRIQQLCDERNLTVNGLSARCGMTQSTLNNIVSGRNNSTTVSTVQKICDGLEMELPDFFNSDLFRNLEQEIY
jgi:DNA-binding Xre family transcriptional regulator